MSASQIAGLCVTCAIIIGLFLLVTREPKDLDNKHNDPDWYAGA